MSGIMHQPCFLFCLFPLIDTGQLSWIMLIFNAIFKWCLQVGWLVFCLWLGQWSMLQLKKTAGDDPTNLRACKVKKILLIKFKLHFSSHVNEDDVWLKMSLVANLIINCIGLSWFYLYLGHSHQPPDILVQIMTTQKLNMEDLFFLFFQIHYQITK